MPLQIKTTKNDILTTLILSIVTTIITLINVPRNKVTDENNNSFEINRPWIAIKAFIMSCIAFYALIYFFSSDSNSSLISNMKQGEPNF